MPRLFSVVLAVAAVIAAQHIPYQFPGNDIAGSLAACLGIVGGGAIGVMASE